MAAPAVVAFCPSAPLLVPDVGVGVDEQLTLIRRACQEAIAEMLEVGPTTVLVLAASGADADETASGTFAPWGVDRRVGAADGSPTLGLSHSIGAWLLDEAGWEGPRRYVVAGASSDLPDRWSLLVIADGSATRTPKAPGSYDPAGEVFDAVVASALASGDPSKLAALGSVEADHVMAQGVSAWHEVGRLAGTATYEGAVLSDVAPFGVGYFVALWR